MKSSLLLSILIALLGFVLCLLAFFATPFASLEYKGPQNNWGEDIPAGIAASALHATRVLDEEPCDWQDTVAGIFRPEVASCGSAREATLHIARNIGKLTGVYYDRGRSKPCMNALEALEEKKVSCTGQSILLVCALRSVGIPARAVGVWTWNHVRGNHTWVEAWFEGSWHMIEFNEKDFNTPWVMDALGMLNPGNPVQRVLAVGTGSGEKAAIPFPTPWNRETELAAEDVTERYLGLARAWYAENGVPADKQKLMVDVQPRSATPRTILLEDEAGKELARAALPTTEDDIRQFATLLLPRAAADGKPAPHYLRLDGTEGRLPVKPTDAPVQTLLLGTEQKADSAK